MASDAPGMRMQFCRFTWPAAGAQVSSVQVCCAPAPALKHLSSVLPSIPGLPFPLTQVTFQPLPFPSFFALPSDSANPDVGGQGGRERPTTFSGQPSTPDAIPPSTLSPLHPPSVLQLGLTLFSCQGDLCHVFLWSCCSGWCIRVWTSPTPWQEAVSARGGGTQFLVYTNVPRGLVASLAVRSDRSPLQAL